MENGGGQRPLYRVLVDDNYHYMDESARYELGTFACCEEAIAACRRVVDEFLLATYEPGMAAEDLWAGYSTFGKDPFVSTSDKKCRFSAWDYARQRCKVICLWGR